MSSDDIERLKKRCERERLARLEAEDLLENKSRELFALNEALQKAVDEREAQVLERTHELEMARDQALANSRAKSQFLANMSHEMRTPLNGVLGMLSAATKTNDKSRQDYLLNTAAQSGQLLLSLINDLLDVSRFESGQVQLVNAPSKVTRVLAGVAPLFMQEAAKRGLEFSCEFSPIFPDVLEVDETRIKQLMCNLVGNAIKFTHQGTVRLSLSLTEGGDVEMCVQDSGIGIAAEHLNSIFEPFVQADSSITRDYGGSGLGLSICKKIVDAMRGSIHVESRLGQGSLFSVRLPLRIVAPAQLPCCLADRDHTLRLVFLVQGSRLPMYLQECLPQLGLTHCDVVSEWGAIPWESFDHNQQLWLFLDGRLASTINHNALMLQKKQQPSMTIITLEMPGVVTSFPCPVDGYLYHPLMLHALVERLLGIDGEVTQAPVTQVPDFRGKHLLVVDDNEINYQVIASLLEQTGLRLSWAANGQRALDFFKETVPDCVLMDIQMPVMDGLTAARHIRALSSSAAACNASHVPIVAMTAHAFEEDREKSLAAGMNDHLTKPVEPEKLCAVLQRYLFATQPISAAPQSTPHELPPAMLSERAAPLDDFKPATLNPSVPSAPTSDNLPSKTLPGFDIAGALQRIGGNWLLLHKLIIGFVTAQQQADRELEQAIAAGDLESVRLLAHKIKGTGATLGAVRLAAAAAAIEQSVKHGSVPAADMMQEFSVALIEACSAIVSEQASDSSDHSTATVSSDPPTKVLSNTQLQQILDMLNAIEKNLSVNLGLVKQELAQLTALVEATALGPFAQQMNQAFNQFKRTELRQLIEQFRAQDLVKNINR